MSFFDRLLLLTFATQLIIIPLNLMVVLNLPMYLIVNLNEKEGFEIGPMPADQPLSQPFFSSTLSPEKGPGAPQITCTSLQGRSGKFRCTVLNAICAKRTLLKA